MALGAIEEIKSTGKNIVVVGFDGNDDAHKAVKEGRLTGTVAQSSLN
jgi:ribose transport system substrate-binding protein